MSEPAIVAGSRTPSVVAEEFDRLAVLPEGWDFNQHEHRHLLGLLPDRVESLLDVGCGTGAFARAVAARCDRVTAIDLSPGMVERARRHPASPGNIEYSVRDVFSESLAPASFDALVSIAAVHHIGLSAAFARFASLLRPGGTMIVVDLVSPESLFDRAFWLAAYAFAPPIRFWNSGHLFQPRAVRAAWALHEEHDSFATMREVRAVSGNVLPGSRARRRLFWRYCLSWKRPDAAR
ncbi:MAG: hypothetical protein QOK37_3698 [Thermoanaerobaculia bacterium]|jgi:cyclopropane fatty-acyl-phospholipid synthase-like methyltransferase|nr:hypothetical protein [Thermoanaerobaculia bacterium]